MNPSLSELTQLLVSSHFKDPDRRVIVAVFGVPGSGKSTIINKVADSVNSVIGKDLAVVIPQDGFHYYMEDLKKMGDYFVARRGAEFTFDSRRLVSQVKKIRNSEGTVYMPSFDHKLKDPVEDSVVVTMKHKIVLIEGNYLCLKIDPWREIMALVDVTWQVTADKDTIRNRVIQRHLISGICETVAEAEARTDNNDLPNGEFILKNSYSADLKIHN